MVHGGDGIFLSSLAALSVLMITSHHQAYNSHASLILHHARPAARLLPAPAHHHLSNREHGTRVTVQELFGNMPVRTKQRAILYGARENDKQWDDLRKQVVGLLLAWNVSMMFTLRSPESSRKLCIRRKERSSLDALEHYGPPNTFDLSLIRSVLSRGGYIEPSEWGTWIETSARTPSVTIYGAISLQPAPSKNVQFISLGIQYLSPEADNFFYDQINQLFAMSSFGQQEGISDCEEFLEHSEKKVGRFKQNGLTKKQLKGSGKGVDRWPMFFIRMDLQSHPDIRCKSDLAKRELDSTLSSISNVLEALIIGFLNDNHFRPRAKRSKLSSNLANESPSMLNRNHSPCQPSSDTMNITRTRSCSRMSDPIPIVESDTSRNISPSLPVGRYAKHREEARAIVLSDTLGSNIKIPSFPRHDVHMNEGFGNWSRIKSGRRHNLQELISQQKSGFRAQQRAEDGWKKEIYSASSASNFEHHSGEKIAMTEASITTNESARADVSQGSDAPLEQSKSDVADTGEATLGRGTNPAECAKYGGVAEDTITWINPISRATVSINARTGLVVSRDQSSSASATKPYDSTINQNRLTRSTLNTPKTGSWISEFLRTWDNPVFSLPEEGIPQVSVNGPSIETSCILQGRNHRCSDTDIQKAFSESSLLLSKKLSKGALSSAEVIAQVDKKFILIKLRIDTQSEQHMADSSSHRQQLLVLVDQHAADERIRIEVLLANLCSKPLRGTNDVPSCVHPKSGVATTLLPKPVIFQVQARESGLFRKHSSHFANWGVLYSLDKPEGEATNSDSKACRLIVRALPDGIAERCRVDPKVLIEFMRGEVWRREESRVKSTQCSEQFASTIDADETLNSHPAAKSEKHERWLQRIGDCPRGILDMLNSRSCRSAIMFNDELTIEECQTLIKRLAMCAFPFQCAHGRPSLIPLVQLDSNMDCFDNATPAFGSRRDLASCPVERDFIHAWKKWKSESGQPNGEGTQ